MNTIELKIKCMKKGIKLSELAKMLGISYSTLTRKMKNGNFLFSESQEISKILDIEDDEKEKIFAKIFH